MTRINRTPGKFEAEPLLTQFAYELSMDGNGETYSDDCGGDSHTIIDGPFTIDELAKFTAELDRAEACLTLPEMQPALEAIGCIVHESTQGFVSCDWLSTQEELDDARTELEEQYTTVDDDDISIPDGWDAIEPDDEYAVIVGNIGMVHESNSETDAYACYVEYMVQSTNGIGRAAGEPVTMMKNGEPVAEWFPLPPVNGMDMQPRYAPSVVFVVGNDGARERQVTRYISHPPGSHPKNCPLVADCTALELQTDSGSRWFGCVSAKINSELRMVVVGTNPRDEARMRWPVCHVS